MQSTGPNNAMVCECNAGFEIVNGANCLPCPIGRFKETVGNSKCADCPVLHSTTAAVGAYSEGLCVCEVHHFANVTAHELRTGVPWMCRPCREIHERRGPMTDCMLNSTLDRITIMPGHWRQTLTAQYVRACDFEDACVGGANVGEALCAEGHTGPLYLRARANPVTDPAICCTCDPLLSIIAQVRCLCA